MSSLLVKFSATAVAIMTLVACAVLPAHADDQPVSTSVLGGVLSATVSGATLSTVTLTGTSALHATGTASAIWSVVDARGTGAAWGLSVSGTNFTSAPGTTDITTRTLPIGNLVLTPGSVTAAVGSTATAPSPAAVTVSTSSQVLLTTAGGSNGGFFLTPSFDLTIPVDAYRSNFATGVSGTINAYVSTLTFTIA